MKPESETANTALRLAARLKASAGALTLSTEEGADLGVMVSNDTFLLMQYLSSGRANRSAYRRFHERIRNRISNAIVRPKVAQYLAEQVSDQQDEIKRMDVNSSSNKRRAIIMPSKEFFLLCRFIHINSRRTRLDEVRRSGQYARFNQSGPRELVELLEA
jgi:hypothetical protein